MQNEIEILQVEKKIRTRVKKQMEKNQKEYYLNEQMQAIQKELGVADEFKNELPSSRRRSRRRCRRGHRPPQEGAAQAQDDEPDERRGDGRAQLHRLGARAAVGDKHRGQARRHRGRAILDEDHYGLEKPKERILEYLAVQAGEEAQGPDPVPRRPARRRQDLAGQVDRAGDGPQVRARVARRRARRGGDPRPPAHLHRRDAGQDHPGPAQGGSSTTRCSCSTRSTRCRWTSAATPRRRCSRCSTPSRTTTFNDHYLDLDYDLSRRAVHHTANSLHTIPLPLQDRMEIIELSGYTEFEKLKIARQYLIPKQLEANGMAEASTSTFRPTRRSRDHPPLHQGGGRALARARDRGGARKLAKYRYNSADSADQIGMANGLAVTMFGGDLLPPRSTIWRARAR
jgi:ATP-dependent Lon protease